MESEKPPAEPHGPSLEIILDNPSEDLEHLEGIIERTIEDPVEFVICDPGVMRFLNLRWRHIDRPTDVLTFDLSSPGQDSPEGVVYIDGRLAPPFPIYWRGFTTAGFISVARPTTTKPTPKR